MEYILSSLEMFAGVSENLINYTFNVCIFNASLWLDFAAVVHRQVPAGVSLMTGCIPEWAVTLTRTVPRFG